MYLACASGTDLEDGQHHQQVLVQNYNIGGRLYNLIYQDYQMQLSRLCSLNIIRKIYSTFLKYELYLLSFKSANWDELTLVLSNIETVRQLSFFQTGTVVRNLLQKFNTHNNPE